MRDFETKRLVYFDILVKTEHLISCLGGDSHIQHTNSGNDLQDYCVGLAFNFHGLLGFLFSFLFMVHMQKKHIYIYISW